MADLFDVMTALENIATTAVYPNGQSNPSIIGTDVAIFSGWPTPANLDAYLSAGKANVSVYPTTMERITTRFRTDWQQSIINAATLTLTILNTTVTVGGTFSSPQTCMVIVNGTGYAYAVQTNDTINTIASSIAALIPGASSVGAVITIPNAYSLAGNISTPGTSTRELKRQERVFMVSIWSPTDPIRSSLSSAIDVLFAATERFALPDNFYASLKYHSTHITDMLEKVRLYRRDLLYSVEYATTQSETDYTIADAYINSLALGPVGEVIP